MCCGDSNVSAITRIEWTNETLDCLVGCSKISPGCANCLTNCCGCKNVNRAAGNPSSLGLPGIRVETRRTGVPEAVRRVE